MKTLQEQRTESVLKIQERITELEKENAELKKEWQEQVQKATDEGYARTLQTIQLSKAKEIIKGLLELGSIGDGDYTYVAQAEQFLSEVENV